MAVDSCHSQRRGDQTGKILKYSGPAACVKCHEQEAANQRLTAMAVPLSPSLQARYSKANSKLTFR
jgi:predicted CXXCH cytochrome family protein